MLVLTMNDLCILLWFARAGYLWNDYTFCVLKYNSFTITITFIPKKLKTFYSSVIAKAILMHNYY